MKLPVVIGTPLLMLGLGIGLEIAIFLSNKYDGMFQGSSLPFLGLQLWIGFKVPRDDIFRVFHISSQQFIVVSDFPFRFSRF